MRLLFFTLGVVFFGTWMNIVFNNYFQIVGLKINWLLLLMLVLSFRFSNLLFPFVSIFAGIICDALSHGIMGIYGSSFFLTILLVSQVKKVFYSNTFLSISIAVVGMSIFEGWLSIFILGLFQPELQQSSLIITKIIPISIIHGFLTPIILNFIIWGENVFLKDIA